MTVASARSPVRFWILAVALACFVAGLVAGFALPEMMASGRPSASPEAYARKLADDYDLTAEQYKSLLMVLQEGERRELEILKNANWSQLPPALRSARLEANRKTEQRIRFVLDERQRALYDRDSRPLGSAPQNGDGPKNR
ncbi:MAG: hypothetical protein KAI24_25475 [Planctomycetes bacterium]|nr:hypothetical protein [Planctomycetota bacterium]